ncbi:polysaccharide biosynthesis domain containing protein 1 [Allomyces javanicus]|nr:polysaccharide biosynthesis domain containing protein 1 [Allomyces javanicus]
MSALSAPTAAAAAEPSWTTVAPRRAPRPRHVSSHTPRLVERAVQTLESSLSPNGHVAAESPADNHAVPAAAKSARRTKTPARLPRTATASSPRAARSPSPPLPPSPPTSASSFGDDVHLDHFLLAASQRSWADAIKATSPVRSSGPASDSIRNALFATPSHSSAASVTDETLSNASSWDGAALNLTASTPAQDAVAATTAKAVVRRKAARKARKAALAEAEAKQWERALKEHDTATQLLSVPPEQLTWAHRAMAFASTHSKRLAKYGCKTHLTKIDQELAKAVRATFPTIDLLTLDVAQFTDEEVKRKWAALAQQYAASLPNDWRELTLLRIRAAQDYTDTNSFVVTRGQFYAIEAARNVEGVNEAFVPDEDD